MVLERSKQIIEYVDQNRRFGRFIFSPLIVIDICVFNKIIIKKYEMTRGFFKILDNIIRSMYNNRQKIKISIYYYNAVILDPNLGHFDC